VPDTQLSLPRKWTTQVQHKFINPQQPLLAHDKVRHVGEAVAVILAESRYAAEDAAQLVSLDLDPLPAVVDPEAALRAGAPVIHDKFATNLIGAFTIGKGDVDAALARAPHKLKRRFHHTYRAAKMGSFHYPVCPKPAITLSRKDWHSPAIGAVLSAIPGAKGAPRSCPAGLVAEVGLRWWRRDAALNRTEDLDVKICKEASGCVIGNPCSCCAHATYRWRGEATQGRS
jgi:Aldehyde oxidase and xanthine dehydrogenase, a/b hammerhead domain